MYKLLILFLKHIVLPVILSKHVRSVAAGIIVGNTAYKMNQGLPYYSLPEAPNSLISYSNRNTLAHLISRILARNTSILYQYRDEIDAYFNHIIHEPSPIASASSVSFSWLLIIAIVALKRQHLDIRNEYRIENNGKLIE